MNNISQAEALLRHLGLTEYESKAYITLLIRGSLTADKISYFSAIPLPRVYDTMAGLSNRGLVLVTKTRPQVFNVVNPSRLSDLLIDDQKKRLKEKMEKIDTTISDFLKTIETIDRKDPIETEEIIAYMKKKINMEKIWDDLHEEANHEIRLFAGDLSWTNKNLGTIKKLIKDGIKYKVIFCKTNPKIQQSIKKLKEAGAELKFYNTGGIRGFIVDGHIASLVEPNTKMEEEEGDYTTILIKNRTIVRLFVNYFDVLWKAGKDPGKM